MHIANFNEGFPKEIMDVIQYSAEVKGIDIHAKNKVRGTLKEMIIKNFKEYAGQIEEYTEVTYELLKLEQAVDLKRGQ